MKKKYHGKALVPGRKPGGGGGGGALILDRNLVPRIEQYAQNHPVNDVDEVAEYLRTSYKEYQRRQLGVFRTMVTRALGAIQRRGGDVSTAHQQTREASDAGALTSDGAGGRSSDSTSHSSDSGRRRSSRQGNGAVQGAVKEAATGVSKGAGSTSEASTSLSDGGSGSGTSSGDGADSGDSGGGEALALAAGATATASRMNSSLLNMYARSGTAATPSTSAGAPPAGDSGPTLTAAFAPPEVVAAAAARALAAEKAEREAKRRAQQGGAKGQTQRPPSAEQPSTSGRDPNTTVAIPRLPLVLTADGPQQQPQGPGLGAAPAGAAAGTAAGSKRPHDGGAGRGSGAAAEAGGDGKQGGNVPRSAAKRPRKSGLGAGGGAGGGGSGARPGGGGGSSVTAAKPVRYADLGGIEEVLSDIRELIEYPLKHPEVYAWLGVEPPRGVLLHGPPGCGKTALANAIANECGVPFLRVSAPEIVSGMSGESEAKLRQLFVEARDLAPCIMFIDEIDAIFPKRETAQREMERRIVAQMLTCMDDLSTPSVGDAAGGQEGAEEARGGEAGGSKDADAARRPPPPHVVVIGATNRPDALDPALRRAGRFDREIALGIPTEAARVKILQVISRRLRLEGNFDFRHVAKRTPGFVGADLAALTKEAAAVAVTRIFSQLDAAVAEAEGRNSAAATQLGLGLGRSSGAEGGTAAGAVQQDSHAVSVSDATGMQVDAVAPANVQQDGTGAPAAGVEGTAGQDAPAVDRLAGGGVEAVVTQRLGCGPLTAAELGGLAITMADFEAALPKVQPSVRREGFTTTPDVTWDDVGALAEVREELSFAVTQPIHHPERFEALGLPAATGVLLYGPPGCGKTLVAKAVANESGANFISIKGPELLNKYVGESERAVRQLFARARAAHPCVLFFDELDALAPRRGTDNNQAAERVVNQLLTEMDGVDARQGIFLVAATNRPDMIDPALLRPGRLDKVLYVPLPPPVDRASILRALVRRTPLEPGVDLEAVARDGRCDGFSGADMAALVREAAVAALKEAMAAGPGGAPPRVGPRHFETALGRVQASVSRKDRRSYEALRLRLRSTRSHIQPDGDAGSGAPTAEEGPVATDGQATSADAHAEGAPKGQARMAE